MSQNTGISYIISSYKAGRYLNRRLDNLMMCSDAKDIEIIIVISESDDFDNCIAIDWMERYPNIIKVQNVPYERYGESWIRGYKLATKDFCCNANCDDLITNKFHSEIYRYMKNAPANVAFGYTDIIIFNELQNKIIGTSQKQDFNLNIFSYECHAGPCVIWRNDQDFKSKLNWNLMEKRAKQYVSAYDYWQWLYFCSLEYSGTILHKPLIIYTQRQDSIEHVNYGTVSTYESLASISEFFPHHFKPGGRLASEYPEFADFNRLPLKDKWIKARKEGRKWQ